MRKGHQQEAAHHRLQLSVLTIGSQADGFQLRFWSFMRRIEVASCLSILNGC